MKTQKNTSVLFSFSLLLSWFEVKLTSLSTLWIVNHKLTLLSGMHVPASCGRWCCQLYPVPFPVPVAILPAPQTSDRKLRPQRKNAFKSDSCLVQSALSDCSLVQSSVTSRRMWHVSHRCFLLDWKSRAGVMNYPTEKGCQKVSGLWLRQTM